MIVLSGIGLSFAFADSNSSEILNDSLRIIASATPLAPPQTDPSILVHHARDDSGGNTSFRFVANRTVSENKYPPDGVTVFARADRRKPQRDRDLGQTFLTHDRRCRLDALYLRIGHADLAALENAPGARIAVQWFEVFGRPTLNDHGTPGFVGKYDRTTSPELDDYLEGEIYKPLRVVEGRLPDHLRKGDYLKLDFMGESEMVFEPHRGYAFLLMFLDRESNRGMTLANEYYGTYTPNPENKYVGHGIRREGTPEFPNDWKARLTQSPGTIGFPDVCTFRDLHFAVTVKSVPETTTAFPLSISENKRYLIDSAGKPFFYQADTAWMLLFKLDAAQAEEYLKNRKAKGFNAIQMMLTGFLDMKNLAGQLPFEGDHDFARPNEAFFTHADGVIGMASDLGMLLAIAPAWSGCCGEGWAGKAKNGSPKPLNQNGTAKCRQYGRWLGQRYKQFDHILWILGGDNDPDNAREEIRQIGLGLKETASHHLITFHAASSHSSTDVWPADEPWLDVSMVYTYFRGFNKAWNKNQPDVYEVSHAEFAKSPIRPFFLGESTYEGEHDDWGSALQARKQAYWCVLGGGFGHAYGSPNWNFPNNWRKIMEQPGANSMKYVPQLFESLPWWTLVPDVQNAIVVEGHGQGVANNSVTAARTSDGSLALIYLPASRPITVDLRKVSGPVEARWYDPTNGVFQSIEGSPFPNEGRRSFDPPEKNRAGDGDWVLMLQTKP